MRSPPTGRRGTDSGRGDCRRADHKFKLRANRDGSQAPRPARSWRSSGSSLLLTLQAGEAGKRARVQFNRDIRPILSENCYACHGPDKNKRKAKLRLDERASAVGLQAIVPGKADESELVARIQSDDAEQVMPPPASRKTLTPAQKDLLKQWIAQGAEYQAHWSYVPPERHPIPSVRERGVGPKSDRRVHPEHARIQGHRPIARGRSADFDTPALARPDRPSPAPEEVRAFEQDADPRAYEQPGRSAPRVSPLR